MDTQSDKPGSGTLVGSTANAGSEGEAYFIVCVHPRPRLAHNAGAARRKEVLEYVRAVARACGECAGLTNGEQPAVQFDGIALIEVDSAQTADLFARAFFECPLRDQGRPGEARKAASKLTVAIACSGDEQEARIRATELAARYPDADAVIMSEAAHEHLTKIGKEAASYWRDAQPATGTVYRRFDPAWPQCFVISPIGGEAGTRANEVLEKYLKPACGRSRIVARRSETLCGDIVTDEMLWSLETDGIAIAFLGGRQPPWNPNVMFELGYRLAADLPVVLVRDMAEPGTKHELPFDIQNRRVIPLPTDAEDDSAECQRAIARIEQQLKERQTLVADPSYVNPLAVVIVDKDEKRGRMQEDLFIPLSDQTKQLFRLNPTENVHRLSEVLRRLADGMPKWQSDAFFAEQDEMIRRLRKGDVSVATVPIVYSEHAKETSPVLAHLPVIVQRVPLGDKLRLKVTYLDVTTATTKEAGHYMCSIGLDRERYEEILADLYQRVVDPPAPRNRDEAWKQYAASYDEILPLLSFYREVRRRHVKFARREGGLVLDVGAGTGNVTVDLLTEQTAVVAIDTCEHMLQRLREKRRELAETDLTIVQGNAERLTDVRDEAYDAVTILLALYDINDPARALAEAIRVLKPGGGVIITEPKKCFDLAFLLRKAEEELKERKDWADLERHWKCVSTANRVLDPKGNGVSRSQNRLWAEDIADHLKRCEFRDVTVEDSHYGNCATIRAVKPK